MAINNTTLELSSKTKTKVKKAYQSHKQGKSITLENDKVEIFLEDLAGK